MTPEPPSGRREEQHQIRSEDGLRLHVRGWTIAQPDAALLLVHGLGEHSGRYEEAARTLNGFGFDAFAADLRGHGLSQGARGHVRRFGHFLRDVQALHRFVTAARPGLPLLLLGHSLGGLIGLRYLQDGAHGLRAAVLSAPALALTSPPPAWQRVLAPLASRLAPRLPFRNGIPAEALSLDPEVVRNYGEDPLVHDRVTPRLYTEMRSAMRRAVEHPAPLPVPLLFLVPLADRIIDSSATLKLAASLRPPAEARTYPGMYHEVLHAPQWREVLRDAASWMRARLP